MQSEIDSLKQRISELEVEKAELEAKNAELLKQAENDKLNARVVKLEQSSNNITHELENSVLHEASSDISSNICAPPSKSKSLEDIETDNFLDAQSKKEVNDMMRKRNKEKKLQTQGSHNTSLPMSIPLIPSEISISNEDDSPEVFEALDLKTEKKLLNQNQSKNQNESHEKKGTENIAQVIADGTSQLFDKATNAEYYAMKANQEETLRWINYGSEFIIQYNDLIKNSNGKIGEKKAKGIIYDKILEHITIIREKRSKEIGLQLPEISRKTLCRKTQRAVKTYKLFEKIGKDKIKYLKTYSTNSISELTNDQIQKIIDNISDRDEFNIEEESNHMTEISTTARRQNHATKILSEASTPIEEIKSQRELVKDRVSDSFVPIDSKTLPETKVSVLPEKVSPEKIPETISEEASTSSNPTHDRDYFRNKILWQHSDLYKQFSNKKFDYYGVIETSLYPVCKLSHKDEKSVRGRYEAGSYFIKCGGHEIEITA
ncbi:hypothetical protein Glove_227g186 [Diversispora epigaea]|uniref:Uncharacterized protein n=1 Tax=Diversispora epigaea TaxID=1348612 RepID=A0A397IEM4_9GLOM|nr:hypothetical protein Glove_227g186 [Diversispora epigaea]